MARCIGSVIQRRRNGARGIAATASPTAANAGKKSRVGPLESISPGLDGRVKAGKRLPEWCETVALQGVALPPPGTAAGAERPVRSQCN